MVLVSDDQSDLAAARGGDLAAFGRIHDRHAPAVLSLCRRRSLAAAEDAAQETFVRAFRMLERIDDARCLRGWLFGIAANVCRERQRADRRRVIHERRFADRAGSVLTSAAPSAADRAADTEQLAWLTEAIQQLDERERIVLHLHYLEPDAVRAATEALHISRATYFRLLARARASLARLMETTTT